MTYRVLDLFSGIGGFSLGLERTGGFKTVAFCEIEPFCQRVLHKHWPDVPCYGDIRELTADRLRADGIAVDVLCGGFPCQDISTAGKRAGIDGERSVLWSEYARLVGELRPQFVIVENVAALLSNGLSRVLGDLAEIGFDAEWHCVPAAAIGAPHRRDRVWVVAYPDELRRDPSSQRTDGDEGKTLATTGPLCEPWVWAARSANVANAPLNGRFARGPCDATEIEGRRKSNRGGIGEDVADTNSLGRSEAPQDRELGRQRLSVASGISRGLGGTWLIEPDVGRVAHGVPSRVDRLRGLGNAVVPQIPEIIGRAILEAEGIA